jgi:cyclopropane-fatty-acyl-phospholipid synthase
MTAQPSPEPPGASPSSIGASPEAIGVHYDVSDDFFRLWLGPEMVYSCALFEGSGEPAAADLAPAQLRKLDHHIEAAGAAGKGRVLDIGCGWGALLERLVAHAGVKQAVGLTISPAQAAWARARARPGVEVREESWRDHKPNAPYDAIISIGAFEHFVHPGLTGARKLESYRDFLRWCHEALSPGGRLSLQTIAYVAPPSETNRSRMTFIAEKIFPESELPLIWEPAAAAEGLFELTALRNDRQHYYQTLRLWEANLLACREQAVAIVGEPTFAAFQRYLRLSSWGFNFGVICLLRMSFRKI